MEREKEKARDAECRRRRVLLEFGGYRRDGALAFQPSRNRPSAPFLVSLNVSKRKTRCAAQRERELTLQYTISISI